MIRYLSHTCRDPFHELHYLINYLLIFLLEFSIKEKSVHVNLFIQPLGTWNPNLNTDYEVTNTRATVLI